MEFPNCTLLKNNDLTEGIFHRIGKKLVDDYISTEYGLPNMENDANFEWNRFQC